MQDELVTVGPDDSITSVCRTLESRRVGSALVVGDGTLAGILTERDIVRAVADGTDLDATPASDYMSQVVTTIAANEPLGTAAQLMTSQGIRHLPVVDGDSLVGVLSIRDVMRGLVRDVNYDEGRHLPQLVDLV